MQTYCYLINFDRIISNYHIWWYASMPEVIEHASWNLLMCSLATCAILHHVAIYIIVYIDIDIDIYNLIYIYYHTHSIYIYAISIWSVTHAGHLAAGELRRHVSTARAAILRHRVAWQRREADRIGMGFGIHWDFGCAMMCLIFLLDFSAKWNVWLWF